MQLDEFQDALQALNPHDFEKFVRELLVRSGRFENVRGRSKGPDAGIDLEAVEIDPFLGQPKRWVFQVKKSRVVGTDVARYMYAIGASAQNTEPTQVVLVVAGSITRGARELLSRTGVKVWDSEKLADLASPSLLTEWFGAKPQAVTPDAAVSDKSASFRSALDAMEPGHGAWSSYQRLVADILEFLLCPPLELPRYEFSDAEMRNRRDILFENPAANEFWALVRDDYAAHYIVVDAKNHADPIPKSAVLDIAHYLKPYGCGMFALLVSRRGPAADALHATREQWIGGQKMIVHLHDVTLTEMLELKAAGGEPQEVIRRQIADFRMSL